MVYLNGVFAANRRVDQEIGRLPEGIDERRWV
jgi:hypothetical protein